jgi:predicted ArsR family transcriptional regulator
MGRPKKDYKLSREDIVEMLKLELEQEVNAMLDKLDKTQDGYEYEQIAISGFSRFNNKWMQAMAGIEPENKNLKKNF